MAMPRCGVEHDYSCERPRATVAEGGRYFNLRFSRSPAMEWNAEQFQRHFVARGVCRGFSFGSRRRMLDRLNQVSVGADLPDFVTLTLPDDCFEDDVGKFSKTAKLHLDVLLKRLRRACESACGFWRIEWMARKSGKHEGKLFPHFHLLVWGVGEREVWVHPEHGPLYESFVPVVELQQEFAGLGKRILSERVFPSGKSALNFLARIHTVETRAERAWSDPINNYMSFFDWMSFAWYHVVGTGNTDHFLAGCRVEKIRSWGGVLSYCAKYMSKADSENFLSEVAFGRSWGIFNRSIMPWAKIVEIDLDDETGVRVRRIARRYLERKLGRTVKRHYGLTLYCDVAQWKRLLESSPPLPF